VKVRKRKRESERKRKSERKTESERKRAQERERESERKRKSERKTEREKVRKREMRACALAQSRPNLLDEDRLVRPERLRQCCCPVGKVLCRPQLHCARGNRRKSDTFEDNTVSKQAGKKKETKTNRQEKHTAHELTCLDVGQGLDFVLVGLCVAVVVPVL
jgi:hypothetical protein